MVSPFFRTRCKFSVLLCAAATKLPLISSSHVRTFLRPELEQNSINLERSCQLLWFAINLSLLLGIAFTMATLILRCCLCFCFVLKTNFRRKDDKHWRETMETTHNVSFSVFPRLLITGHPYILDLPGAVSTCVGSFTVHNLSLDQDMANPDPLHLMFSGLNI